MKKEDLKKLREQVSELFVQFGSSKELPFMLVAMEVQNTKMWMGAVLRQLHPDTERPYKDDAEIKSVADLAQEADKAIMLLQIFEDQDQLVQYIAQKRIFFQELANDFAVVAEVQYNAPQTLRTALNQVYVHAINTKNWLGMALSYAKQRDELLKSEQDFIQGEKHMKQMGEQLNTQKSLTDDIIPGIADIHVAGGENNGQQGLQDLNPNNASLADVIQAAENANAIKGKGKGKNKPDDIDPKKVPEQEIKTETDLSQN